MGAFSGLSYIGPKAYTCPPTMAGASNFQPTPGAPPLSAPPPSDQWGVEYSRFFNTPRGPPSRPTAFRRLPKCKIRSPGRWLTAASPAVIVLSRPHGAAGAILSVSIRGKLYEEHYVSDLYFSWPQVSCVAECPVRGSRTVFMSYKEGSSQVQKFAVRFSASATAQGFVNSAKECTRVTTDSRHMCGSPSTSEMNFSNGMLSFSNATHNRYQEESSYGEQITTVAPEIPAVTFNNEEPRLPLLPLLASNNVPIFSGLPPYFTEMLTNSTYETPPKTNLSSQSAGCQPGPSFHDAVAIPLPASMDGTQLTAHATNYISAAAFNDLLSRIEGVIHEYGGDLAVEPMDTPEAALEARAPPEAKTTSSFFR